MRDNGPGIPPEKLAAIFDPYFTTKAEGSGLGLWIAQQIVMAHGGKLLAENAAGRRRAVHDALPLRERTEPLDKSKVKILVVDDEQGLCAGVQEALRREGLRGGCRTDRAGGAQAGRRAAATTWSSRTSRCPGLSGLELLARVRARSRDTLFILMTAFGTVENAVEAMKQGAYDYLPKPIDMKRLRAAGAEGAGVPGGGGGEQRTAARGCRRSPNRACSSARAKPCALWRG